VVDTWLAIASRRETREYADRPVPDEIVHTILDAGRLAGSASNRQPWRFVVVENREFKRKLLQTALPIWKRFFESIKGADPDNYDKVMKLYNALEEPKDIIYYSAPTILFVIGPADDPNPINCALACENIMLAACSLGLGSCYTGFGSLVKSNPEVAQTLELKDNERIYGPILLGYPKEMPETEALRWKKKEPVIKWI